MKSTELKSLEDLNQFSLAELKKLCVIPSISFDGFDHAPLTQSAEATADLFRRVGFDNVKLESIENCFPYVVAEKIVDTKTPTLLLYAHHDVQPAGREELWKSPPFIPTEREGRLFGRGTSDDKAGILVHAAALCAYTSGLVPNMKVPPVNLKVVIEGEEEVGSSHLFKFLEKNKERLKSDVIVVTDTGNIKAGIPSMTTSLRGLAVVDIEVKSLRAPLHSGIWGGAVVDPVQVLTKILAKLSDDDGRPLLKSVRYPKKSRNRKVPLTLDEFADQAGVLRKEGIPADFAHRIWDEPSFSINAIQASSEKLANNVICDRAYARIGIRLTADENAIEVQNEMVSRLQELCPKTVELNLKKFDVADAWEIDPYQEKHRWAFEAAEIALERGFKEKAVYIGCGASIPFIGPFEKAFEAPVISLGIEDPLALAHSENESLLLSDFYKVIASEIELFQTIIQSHERVRYRG